VTETFNYPLVPPAALEPPAEWAKMHAECPVATVRLVSGDEAKLVTRYDDVRELLADPRFNRQLNDEGAARISTNESGGAFQQESTVSSGPGHQRWRRLVAKYFTARRMMALESGIEGMTERLVDEMTAKGDTGELIAAVSFPLPVWVICQLLGVPDSDRDKFSHWSDTMLNLDRYTNDEVTQAQAEFHEYMTRHLDARRAEPGEDLLSELVTVTDAADGRLSQDELMQTAQGLLVAGHETTANMIGKMVAILLADRSRWEALVADPSLVRLAVEEVLRFDPMAGFGLPRYVTEEIEISGTVLPRGTTVVCSMSAANRDENMFPSANEFDMTRMPNQHITFGAGAHACLGQALARTELQTVLSVLLRKLPTLELAVPAEQLKLREGLLVGGLAQLPVRW
jgi:cytochrome P450